MAQLWLLSHGQCPQRLDGQKCRELGFLLNYLLYQNIVLLYFEGNGYITLLNWCFDDILIDSMCIEVSISLQDSTAIVHVTSQVIFTPAALSCFPTPQSQLTTCHLMSCPAHMSPPACLDLSRVGLSQRLLFPEREKCLKYCRKPQRHLWTLWSSLLRHFFAKALSPFGFIPALF